MVSTELERGADSPEWKQIKRDLNRTFPNCEYFAKGNSGQIQLERVLLTFTKYNKKIGYVQGMNFVVGALLFHCSEDIAFWLFVSLIEDYEMREIYSAGLPGLYKHTNIIDTLMREQIRPVYSHFVYLDHIIASTWHKIRNVCNKLDLYNLLIHYSN